MIALALLPQAPILTVRAAPTYGELVTSAIEKLNDALSHGSGPFSGGQEAHAALVGYERFLGVLGQHARLLAAPGCADLTGRYGHGPQLQELLQRMTSLKVAAATPAAPSLWRRASDLLAAAHDLLATHVGSVGQLRTPDGELLSDPSIRWAATARLLDSARRALEGCGHLLTEVAATQRADDAGTVTRAHVSHVRQASAAILRLIATQPIAAMSRHPAPLADLDAVPPAITRTAQSLGTSAFDDALAALRVLRLLSFRQACGDEHASPGCLHDVSRLAITTTRSAEQWLPESTTSLGRVQRAVAHDELLQANKAWRTAANGLGQEVMSLRKAPRVYADAIRLLHEVPAVSVARAVLAALPRLGMDASATIDRLSANGDLVVATRDVGRFQASWERIDPEHAVTLADAFKVAGRVSHRAHAALEETRRPRSAPASPTTRPNDSRALRRGVDVGAGLP